MTTCTATVVTTTLGETVLYKCAKDEHETRNEAHVSSEGFVWFGPVR